MFTKGVKISIIKKCDIMKNLKKFNILGVIITIISIVSLVYVIYSVSLLKNIETFYRTMGLIILCLLFIVSIYSIIDGMMYYKRSKIVVFSIISLLLSIMSIVVGSIITDVYNKLDNMSSTKVEYKTVLLSLNDITLGDVKDLKIGVTNNEEDITGYILPYEVIDKNKLEDTNEIVKVSDTITLMSMFLSKELDVIFISSNYLSMFKNIEDFDENTVFYEVTSYGKDYKKSEVETEVVSTNTEITKPFTILLLGLDSTEDGIEKAASYNGDTIMLLAVDPSTMHVTMFSIPRDTYVTMACGGNITKINHASWGGTYCMVKTVEKFTGIDIDYYATINFRGVVDLVDALGGITIDVPMTFCEQLSNREGELCLDEGVQTLNGEEALAVARHRKTLALGDFQRGQNQQVVVEGMLDKIKTLRSVSDFYNVLNTVSRNIDTNMSTDEMLSLYNIAKNILIKGGDLKVNITKTFLTGYSLMAWEGYNYTYTFQYYKQSLADIVNAIKINLGEKEQEVIKEFSFSLNEPYEREIVGYTYYNEASAPTMNNLVGMGEVSAKAWAESMGLNVTVVYAVSTDYEAGTVIDQSIHEDVLLEKTDYNLTLTVASSDSSVVNTTLENEDDEEDAEEEKGEEETNQVEQNEEDSEE